MPHMAMPHIRPIIFICTDTIAILFLVILVQAIQSLGMTLVKKVDRRAR